MIQYIKKTLNNGIKLGTFLVAGIPAFAIAIALNWFLVSKGGWHKSISYALVLFLQISTNFFICRSFVFSSKRTSSILKQYSTFMSGILIIRGIDWILYSLLVNSFGFHYLIVQLFNVAIFSILKYKFSKNLIEQ